MKQIGGDGSTLFSLTSVEWEKLREEIENHRIKPPVSMHPEGPAGGLARFHSLDDAKLALLAVV
ncbi:hypothetical protein HNP52_000039 [Sphingomonas kyeonggiensis]|jgi:hypothetical protein|uniref:Uncharacterized protein n=1 Tax=Sphingomonas kyeonggiensis TaxID=1268553 RepID=A0A7W7NPM6_9SPHN|nr:hypothetical protein [Sphingomonas kyeonggiensis]MBB4836988.1 hypothetical protein [Sphingomonas kyeonggiensis]